MARTTMLSIAMFMTSSTAVLACELCKRNQPKVLQNITHGAGPTGTIDYIITWSAVVMVTITLVLSIKFLIRPRENQPGHIKNIVLDQQ